MTTVSLPPPTALIGAWTFDRTVHDRRAGAVAHAVGVLSIRARHPDALTWDEHGELRVGASVLEVRRHHMIRRTAAGWTVLFDDGREFHRWAPGRDVTHHCGADRYRGRYELARPEDGWSVRWECVGPSKDYVVETVLQRPG